MKNGLKRLRKSAGMTQEQAAAVFGLSRSGYVKIEDGDRRLTDRYIRRAKQVFNTEVREVLGDERMPPHKLSGGGAFDLNMTDAEYSDLGRAVVDVYFAEVGQKVAAEVRQELVAAVMRRHGNLRPQYLELLHKRMESMQS